MTEAPDLVSVKIAAADPYDGAVEFVMFCFDSTLSATVSKAGLWLVGFNAATMINPTSVSRSLADTKCAEAQFNSGVDVFQYSLGAVDAGAVKDVRGFPNVPSSAPLEGSTIANRFGDTTEPQLIAAFKDVPNNAIIYEFDTGLDQTHHTGNDPSDDIEGIDNPTVEDPAAYPVAGGFKFYEADGTEKSGGGLGSAVVSVEENRVTVTFGNISVAGAVRYAVGDGAVENAQIPNPGGVPGSLGSVGAATSKPELARAQIVPGTNQIDFDFDELVEQPDIAQGKFRAYTQNGSFFPATKATLVGNGRIRATFGGASDFMEKVVRVVAMPDAVTASESIGQSPLQKNVLSMAGVAPSHAAVGFTEGPDLLQVSVDESSKSATFEFDSAIKRPTLPAEIERFQLVDGQAHVFPGQDVIGVGGTSVTISFVGSAATIEDVVGGAVLPGAAMDLEGRPNAVRSLRDSFRIEAPSFQSDGPPGPDTGGPSPLPSGSPSPGPSGSPQPDPSEDPVHKQATSVDAPEDMAQVKGRELTFYVTATDETGTPIADTPVRVDMGGIGRVVSADARTSSAGRAFITVEASEPGTQEVTTTVDECAEGHACIAQTSVRWVEKSSQKSCTIVGTADDDVLQGTEGNDVICGFGGDDIISGGDGDDIVLAGAGEDIVKGQAGDDILKGEGGTDVIGGGAGEDTLYAGPGDDRLDGGPEDDICVGGLRSRRCEG